LLPSFPWWEPGHGEKNILNDRHILQKKMSWVVKHVGKSTKKIIRRGRFSEEYGMTLIGKHLSS
jgi:hypothetical protein